MNNSPELETNLENSNNQLEKVELLSDNITDSFEEKKIQDFNLELDRIIYFIHIPKTAGTSLESKQIIKLGHNFNVPKIFRVPASKGGFHGYKTNSWDIYKYPKNPNYKITIIRNPFDLLTSYYFNGEKLKSNRQYCESGWASVNYTHQFKSFKQFIYCYCHPKFNWHIPALKNFLFSQLFDKDNKCVADIIVKYEYLDEAIDILNLKLKDPIIPRKKNVSKYKNKNYKEYYDNEMKKMVYNKCWRELKYFNYSFDGSTKYEPIILNCQIKYDVYNNKIVK